MNRNLRFVVAAFAALSLVAVDGAFAQPKDKDQKEHRGGKGAKEDKGPKEKKQKEHKHKNGKDLLGAKIKQNGKQKLEVHGKHTAYANVKDGKITGMTVESADQGPVKVTKYKTSKKMAEASATLQPASLVLAQYNREYVGSTWIGYSYIDEWGDEVIYWYPYDMIYDGDTDAIEYVPAY